MRKDEFKAGEEWAHRSGQQLGTPASRVELLFMPDRKGHAMVKVRHLDGDMAGYEEFVHATHLRCRWRDWRKVERDEARELAFYERLAGGPEVEQVVLQAALEVLAASGEDTSLVDYRNHSRIYAGELPGFERIAERAGVDGGLLRRPPSFTNRDGDLYLPNSYLVELAVAFARAEPESVNLHLDNEEQELLERGYARGDRYWHEQLLSQKPAWVLARRWAEREGARDHLRDELERVRRVAREAIRALEEAGDERTATRLGRRLDGH